MDAVRFLIGDTDAASPQLGDPEVNWLISQFGSVHEAAIAACSQLAARYARQADKTTGDLSIRSSTISKQYLALIPVLKAQSARISPPKPYAGGIRISDMAIDQEDDDAVQPAFAIGGMDDKDETSTFNRISG